MSLELDVQRMDVEAEAPLLAGEETRDAVLRRAGWSGGAECLECGLHEFGSLPESEVCDACTSCRECGCVDDCEARPWREHYGASLDEVHPERNEVVLAALERFEAGEDTPADRFVLWSDCALQEAVSQINRLLEAVESLCGPETGLLGAAGRLLLISPESEAIGDEIAARREARRPTPEALRAREAVE